MKDKLNIIIIGNTNNFDIALSLIKNKNLNILAGIVDSFTEAMEIKQRDFLKTYKIPEISFKDVRKYKPDVCLVLTYNRIINTEDFDNTLLLNIHGGILPKWRGASANAWAVINGEKEVGYSLHRVTDILDGGDICYVYKSKIKSNEKYGEVIPKLRKGMIKQLPKILREIISGKLTSISQENAEYLYTPRLRKSDGIIKDWNKPSSYLYNLYRVMGSPYGTGVFFEFKNNIYEINEMHLINSYPNYIGIPGAIVYLGENFLHIKTADNIIEVKSLTNNKLPVDIKKIFKIGMRL